MFRATILLLLVIFCAPLASAGEAVVCPSCSYSSYRGCIVCWACGVPLPGAKKAGELVNVAILAFDYHSSAAVVEVAGPGPEILYEQLLEWLGSNPDKHDEALERLRIFLDGVRGTALEGEVATRIESIEKLKAELERPKTLAEREAEAVQAVVKAMPDIRRLTDRREKMRRLEELLGVAKGTSYEEFVQRELQRARGE